MVRATIQSVASHYSIMIPFWRRSRIQCSSKLRSNTAMAHSAEGFEPFVARYSATSRSTSESASCLAATHNSPTSRASSQSVSGYIRSTRSGVGITSRSMRFSRALMRSGLLGGRSSGWLCTTVALSRSTSLGNGTRFRDPCSGTWICLPSRNAPSTSFCSWRIASTNSASDSFSRSGLLNDLDVAVAARLAERVPLPILEVTPAPRLAVSTADRQQSPDRTPALPGLRQATVAVVGDPQHRTLLDVPAARHQPALGLEVQTST